MTLNWPVKEVYDLLSEQELNMKGGAFDVEMDFGEVRVFHCINT